MSTENDVVGAIGMLMVLALLFILLHVWVRLERLLDRYRLKYGFDKDIESKEAPKNNDGHLERREKQFKRRVFKD